MRRPGPRTGAATGPALAAWAVLVLWASAAWGLVLHPDDAAPADRPPDAVIGRWGSNASCVVIDTQHVLTTKHQGGGAGTTVYVAGLPYTVTEVFNHGTGDVRVAYIAAADFTEWVGVYAGSGEVGRVTVIGGYGKGRGAELKTGNKTYGYAWQGAANDTLRWGANVIEWAGTASGSPAVMARFDGKNEGNYVAGEGAPAEWDSGGGWFVWTGAAWQVAALTWYTEHAGETWFRNKTFPNTLDPDELYAHRVSVYAGWAQGILDRSTWTLDGDGAWLNPANWSKGVPSGVDRWAVLGSAATANRTVTLDAPVTIGTVRFDDDNNYTIAGGHGLTFDVSSGVAGIEVRATAGAGNHAIAVPITLNDPLTVTHNATSVLTLSAGIGGTGGLTKAGWGTLVLGAANAFAGNVTLSGGTLRVTHPSGLGAGNKVTLAGGTLDLRSDSSVAYGKNLEVTGNVGLTLSPLTSGSGETLSFGSLTVVGDRTLTVWTGAGYRLTLTGLAKFNVSTTGIVLDAGADVRLAGGVDLAMGTLTKRGAAALTIEGAQVYGTGAVLKVESGRVNLNSNAGTPATGPGKPAVANLTLSLAGGSAVLGTAQDLGGLTWTAGTLDLADRLVRLYTPDPAATEASIRGFLLAGGIRDSLVAADERIGYTDQRTDAAGRQYVAIRAVYAGDLDMDGCVSFADFTDLLANYDQPGTKTWDQGDLNYDGSVSFADFAHLLSNYGKTGGNHVPEPATLALVGVGAVLAWARRRHRRRRAGEQWSRGTGETAHLRSPAHLFS